MIIIISFLSYLCRRHRNYFRRRATLKFERRFDNLVEFYFPSSYFFREKFLLYKGSILSNEDFAFGSMIEGIPNSFLRVSYEDAFFRFGFKLVLFKVNAAVSNA